jgi:ligand-binding sensor domain-containing protein/signal transduction histidine kinase
MTPMSFLRTALFITLLGWFVGWQMGGMLPVSAAPDSFSAHQLSFRVWQVKDGMPQNQVRAMLQTRTGYIWVATNDGLAKFDGARFVTFNRENTPALRSNIFTSLYEDRAGTLWIGSDGGLVRFSNGQFTTFTTAQGLAADTVTSIVEAPAGTLLVATGHVLNRFQEQQFSRVQEFVLPASRSIRQFCVTRAGDVWIATNAGAFQLRGTALRHYTLKDGLSTENLNTIYEDRQGNLWFGTIGQGLICWTQQRFLNYLLKAGATANIVFALAEDSAGKLWVGTHAGLYRFSEGQLTNVARREGLPSDFVTALFTDHEGSLWVGTDGGGLAQVRDSGVQGFRARNGLAGDLTRSIVEDQQGNVWVASWFSDSVSLFQTGRWVSVGKGHPLLKEGVRALLTDRNGVLWLAVASNRLVSFQQGQFKEHPLKADPPTLPIFALGEDEQGRLWLGRSDGLYLYGEGELINQTAALRLPTPGVRIILPARAGGLWVGTESGLVRYYQGPVRRYDQRDGLPYPFVSGLYEDAEGVLWVGTRGGGLSRLKDGAFTTITMKQGLPADAVYQMLEDDQQNLWCGSSRGIFRVSRRELNLLADGKLSTLSSVAYGHAEGMQNSVHFGTHPSACRTRDGRLWFPTTNGVVMIAPERLRFNTIPPPVVIEQTLVDKQSMLPALRDGEINAPPGRGEVEIHYAGLSYVAPELVNFRYRLEGYKPEWIEAGPRRTAYYTNLPPGSYTFRVLASNNDGVWNETGAVIRFKLRPHFYQTWWFYAACTLAVMGLGWLMHRQRLRQMQVRHAAVMAERNRIARDIHDTLAQEVAGLLAQLHVIKTLLPVSPQTAGRHLERAVELARTGLADARRLVLDLRHQALEHDDLATALENFIAQVTADGAPEVNYQVKGTPRRLASEYENNLLRIGQESVTNALRHAQASLIEVSLSFEPKLVELRVKDDGCGFDPAAHAQGFGGHYGLLGIRERAAQIGGELSLASAPGAGTEIKVRVRTGNSS